MQNVFIEVAVSTRVLVMCPILIVCLLPGSPGYFGIKTHSRICPTHKSRILIVIINGNAKLSI